MRFTLRSLLSLGCSIIVFTSVGLFAPHAAADVIAHRIAIAWDDTTAGKSYLGYIDAASPTAFGEAPIEVPGDGIVRFAFDDLYHLSRSAGVITRVGGFSWQIEQTYTLGAPRELRDIAVISPTTAYLADRADRSLLRLDLATGVVTNAVDLRGLGVAAGVLSPEMMLVHEGRLYLQLRRPLGSVEKSLVAVIDLATESIVDVDPMEPGDQAILLAGTEPRHKMQIVPGTNRLMLSATGALLDSGGLETIDLDTFLSEGIALGDTDGFGVNDFGPFVMVDSDRGWFSGATSIVPSSHLHDFSLSNPQPAAAYGNEIFFNSPHLVYDHVSNRIFWPIPDGIRFFDATTTAQGAGSPALILSGTTTDIEGMELSQALPVFAGELGVLSLVLALLVSGCYAARPGASCVFGVLGVGLAGNCSSISR